MLNHDYNVTQSINKLMKDTQDALLTDDNWIKLGDTKRFYHISTIKDDDKDTYYKVMTIDNPINIGLFETNQKGQTKKKTSFKQQLIITYNKKYDLYQKSIRNSQITRAYELIKEKRIDTHSPTSSKRFAKHIGEKPSYDIDQDKIATEIKYDGYYALVTSLENDNVSDILKVIQRRWEIEESFRIMKTNFKSKPVFHQKDRRIISHFTICFTALLIYRLLEKKLDSKCTINEIIGQLKTMNVTPINEAIFESVYKGSQLLDDLGNTFNMFLDKKSYLNTYLNKMK